MCNEEVKCGALNAELREGNVSCQSLRALMAFLKVATCNESETVQVLKFSSYFQIQALISKAVWEQNAS